MAVRDARLGRLLLLTYGTDVAHQLGDTLDAVGGGVVAGERRARSLKLTLPVHGDGTDVDPYAAGNRMRRQLVALMENGLVKLQALYFSASPDPELNGWLVVGGGDLTYGQGGGPTLGDYQLEFTDVYRVATWRTHRAARRAQLADRRLATTPRDIQRTIYGTDYGALTALPIMYLPVGAADITGLREALYTPGLRTSQGGGVACITGMQNAEVVSYEQAEASMGLQDDVVIYDRQGRGDVQAGYGSRVLLDGPLAWWRLDEATGAATATDSGVAGLYPGSYIGTPTLRAPSMTHDPDTYSALLSGPDAVYVKVPDAAALHLVGDMSVEGMIQPLNGTANLVNNPTYEGDAAGWAADGAPTTYAIQTGWSAYGTHALRITKAAVASGSSIGATTFTGLDGIPCIAGRSYTARYMVNPVAVPASTTPGLTFRWYKADGTANGTTVAAAGAALVNGTVATYTATASAPALTAYMAISITVAQASGGAATIDYYVDAVQLTDGTVAPAWTTLRPRYDTIASKWSTAATYRAWRFAYDYYSDALVYELSTDGSARARAVSAPLGLAAAAVAAGLGATPTAHVACAYNAALGRVTFYYNGAQVGQVTGLPTSIYAATTTINIGKWEADQV